jgi:hypothetical protein
VALVTYAPLVTAIKGSIGGVTFQANTAGQICRARTRPYKPVTEKQRTVLPKLTIWLPIWRTLDLDTQVLWNDFATAHPHTDFYGRVRHLTGFNYFCRLNSQLIRAYQTYITVPPTWGLPGPINGMSIVLHPGTLMVDYDPDPQPDTWAVTIYLSPAIWRSASPFRQHLRYCFTIPAYITGPWDLHQVWETMFYQSWPPPGTDGMSIQGAAYFIDINTGLTSSTAFANAQLPPV